MPSRILVVSPDPNLVSLLGQAMSREGHEVLLAKNPADGQRRIGVDRPALTFLDMGQEGGDATDTVGRLRGSQTGQRSAIVLIGEGDPASRVRGLRSGADDYMTKPVHPAELVARTRRLLARMAQRPAAASAGAAHAAASSSAPVEHRPRPLRGEVHAYYGAKGGVGTTTMAINAAIALHRVAHRKVCLVDANLQFGDHRVFLDLGPERASIVDAVTAPNIDADLLRNLVVNHSSGVDLLLAPPSPEQAELVSNDRHDLVRVVETLRTLYDYVIVDLDKRLDDNALDVIGTADRLFVVMTADLSCLKNVRLVLETMSQIGTPADKVELLLNRSNAFTGINVKSIEGVLKRTVEFQVVNDYRAAISALNSGDPFMVHRSDTPIGRSMLEFVRQIDTPVPVRHVVRQTQGQRQLLPALT
ncbi:MAG: pilus assembly protein CpaE [Chloroflexota bacterium]|jgi:pilus assembly protein CpaE|nr:pilus assembly protein CpaE [Chloroflexota bacterium]